METSRIGEISGATRHPSGPREWATGDFAPRFPGFLVVPDTRGYGASSKPGGVANYDLDILAADVAALADCSSKSQKTGLALSSNRTSSHFKMKS